MKLILKSILPWVGSALAITGVIFVIIRMSDYSSQIDYSRFDKFILSFFGGLILVFGFANVMLALAWRNLLIHLKVDISRLWAIRIFGLTQLAKYIPGNIVHLVGRQAMGQAEGVSGWPLSKSSVWEIGLISTASIPFAVLVLPQYFIIISELLSVIIFATIVFFIMLVLKVYMSMSIMRAFGWYVIFLAISGAVFASMLFTLRHEGGITFSHGLLYFGAFIVAWLVGLVTPGAPAGIGVREIVLLALLKTHVFESDLLLAVLLSRIVTVGGDIFLFLFASFLWFKNYGLRLPSDVG